MKIELEISDGDIRSHLEEAMQKAVRSELVAWKIDNVVAKMVRLRWPEVAEHMIEEAVKDSDVLRKTIALEIEKKIRANLARAMKAAQ